MARSLGVPHFVLTTSNDDAQHAFDHFGPIAKRVEISTPKEFPCIQKVTWSDLLKFLKDTQDRDKPLSRDECTREALAAFFPRRGSRSINLGETG